MLNVQDRTREGLRVFSYHLAAMNSVLVQPYTLPERKVVKSGLFRRSRTRGFSREWAGLQRLQRASGTSCQIVAHLPFTSWLKSCERRSHLLRHARGARGSTISCSFALRPILGGRSPIACLNIKGLNIRLPSTDRGSRLLPQQPKT